MRIQPCEALLPDAAGLVGAMDAKLSPRDVQPQKPRAEASQIARKTAGNAKDANGRRRIARACGHSVALFDLRALIEGQGLLRDINPDPGPSGTLARRARSCGVKLPLSPPGGAAARLPAPASSAQSNSAATGRFHVFAMPAPPSLWSFNLMRRL